MAMSITWDEADPKVGDPANLAHVDMQEIKVSVRERIAVEHDAPSGDNTDTWRHSAGSGRIRYGLAAARPAAGATNDGSIYVSEDSGAMEYSNGTSWLTMGGGGGALYSTGTATVVNGDATVEGAGGTQWTDVAAGDVFWLQSGSRYYAISSITDDDTLELAEDYEEGNAGGQDYYIGRTNLSPQFMPSAGGTGYGQTFEEPTLGSDMAAGGFSVTGLADPTANGEAERWEHSQEAVLDHPDASVVLAKLGADVKIASWSIGKYTGDGNDAREIEAGVDLETDTPAYMILIYPHSNTGAGNSWVIKTNEHTVGDHASVTRENNYAGTIVAIHDNGFTIDGDNDVNKLNIVYGYVVILFGA